jgi:hypothetical protein
VIQGLADGTHLLQLLSCMCSVRHGKGVQHQQRAGLLLLQGLNMPMVGAAAVHNSPGGVALAQLSTAGFRASVHRA